MHATSGSQAGDRDIERLTREIGDVIERAPPEEKEELRQMASDLILQETARARPEPVRPQEATQRRLGVIAFGGLLLILGAGLSLIFPPIGLLLVGSGLTVIVLGALYHMVTG